jgi:hypothetical protein
MKTPFLLLIAVFLVVSAEQKQIVNVPFGSNFNLKTTESGEPLTVAAFATDSSHLYLYDMADRSIATLDRSGVFLKKTPLQNIGRRTYTGDDFIIRSGEAIFLNAVDFRIEYFDIETGNLKKSIPYPRQIPGDATQRRYRMVTRIFLDNLQIFLGNSHAVFLFDELPKLQKQTALKVMRFPAGESLLIFNSQNSVVGRSGKIHWAQKSAILKTSGYPMFGKNAALINSAIYLCTVSNSGITISSIDLTE